jgi:hypothetical protein
MCIRLPKTQCVIREYCIFWFQFSLRGRQRHRQQPPKRLPTSRIRIRSIERKCLKRTRPRCALHHLTPCHHLTRPAPGARPPPPQRKLRRASGGALRAARLRGGGPVRGGGRRALRPGARRQAPRVHHARRARARDGLAPVTASLPFGISGQGLRWRGEGDLVSDGDAWGLGGG